MRSRKMSVIANRVWDLIESNFCVTKFRIQSL